MKANGTPTVHYRLDQSKLIQKITEFLGLIQAQILSWMGLETTHENGENRPSDAADTDQLSGQNQPNEMGEDEPFHSAETAQSITDSNSQNKLHNNPQDRQQNRFSAVVVDSKRDEEKEILVSLGYCGIAYPKAKELIEKYGPRRVEEIIKQAKDQNCKNAAGYIIRALAENWTFYSTPVKEDYACGNGLAYFTGKYGAFIEH